MVLRVKLRSLEAFATIDIKGAPLRLLTRTTRSVATTEAGERLLRTVGPEFEQIDSELSALTELRENLSAAAHVGLVDRQPHSPA
jgi:hypothetical protein